MPTRQPIDRIQVDSRDIHPSNAPPPPTHSYSFARVVRSTPRALVSVVRDAGRPAGRPACLPVCWPHELLARLLSRPMFAVRAQRARDRRQQQLNPWSRQLDQLSYYCLHRCTVAILSQQLRRRDRQRRWRRWSKSSP